MVTITRNQWKSKGGKEEEDEDIGGLQEGQGQVFSHTKCKTTLPRTAKAKAEEILFRRNVTPRWEKFNLFYGQLPCKNV